jgi:hypothetical protein
MSTLQKSEFSTDLSSNSVYTDDLKDLVPFWFDNPNIMFQAKYVTEFFPVDGMTYNQKLNAITRSVILITIASFLYSQKLRVLIVGILSVSAIYVMHYFHVKNAVSKEGYEPGSLEDLNAYDGFEDMFDTPSSTNPFSNVLLPDYDYNVDKKPAPPAFNDRVSNSILDQAKQIVIEQNPGQPDIADKLFTDLGEQYIFEQSLKPFYSNPATTIPNDQAGFSDFCYGGMVSCKEGNLFACARNLDRHTN